MKWLWLQDLVRKPKDAEYAKIVLDRYRLGIKAHGEIRGARIIPGSEQCEKAMSVAGKTYLPDDAPLIPIQGCSLPGGCCCSYTPVMKYEPQMGEAAQPEPVPTV
jgi:hypothetical protein